MSYCVLVVVHSLTGFGAPNIAAASDGVTPAQRARTLREVNVIDKPSGQRPIAIVGAQLIDGRGGKPLRDAVVVVEGSRISAVGARGRIEVPAGAEIVGGEGMAVLPGFLDAHFHLGGEKLPGTFLRRGVTSVRDPGAWIESYDGVRAREEAIPRLFLTGPHLDVPPTAYPNNSLVVRDAVEGRAAVYRFADQGASAVKVYFRLPMGTIRAICEAAHQRGLVVTAHLEIVDADDAIRAGVDGIEHVTSFGTALVPERQAERYRQTILADNSARDEGRYEMWNTIDLSSPRMERLLEVILANRTFVSPTLGVFERREGDKNATEVHVHAYETMLDFVRRAHGAGAQVVVGSHAHVPHAEYGWAYHRELELLVECGMSPLEAIHAGTWVNARFFRVEDRLGSVEVGKAADLVLVAGDPSEDIRATRNVRGVLLGGRWVVRPD